MSHHTIVSLLAASVGLETLGYLAFIADIIVFHGKHLLCLVEVIIDMFYTIIERSTRLIKIGITAQIAVIKRYAQKFTIITKASMIAQ